MHEERLGGGRIASTRLEKDACGLAEARVPFVVDGELAQRLGYPLPCRRDVGGHRSDRSNVGERGYALERRIVQARDGLGADRLLVRAAKAGQPRCDVAQCDVVLVERGDGCRQTVDGDLVALAERQPRAGATRLEV